MDINDIFHAIPRNGCAKAFRNGAQRHQCAVIDNLRRDRHGINQFAVLYRPASPICSIMISSLCIAITVWSASSQITCASSASKISAWVPVCGHPE